MVYPTGCATIDNQIMLDGRLLTGLPSGHVVAIVENPEEQRDFPEHFLSLLARNADGPVWWVDLINQYGTSVLENVMITHWHDDKDWDRFVGLIDVVFDKVRPVIVVLDNAFAFNHCEGVVFNVLGEIQRMCAKHDCLGFFLTYDTGKKNHWAGDGAVRNFCSYVIDWDQKKIIYSTVMDV